MKLLSFLVLMLLINLVSGQSILEWSSDLELELDDFQSTETEVNSSFTSYSIYTGASMDFSFQMNTYQFMLTKNFNNKVKTTFNKNAAVIIAPDSSIAKQLVSFGQYSFDLTELYARKFRRNMYEEKGAFSSSSFFKPIFNQLQEQMNQESSRVLKATDLGRKTEKLELEHQKVLNEIDLLSDFCFDCKPPRRQKK